MGVFNFLKTVGDKVFKSKEPELNSKELKGSIDALKLGTEDVKVIIVGDKVVLKGTVKDQATFEKVVLAAGNNVGVASVDADLLKIAGSPAEAETAPEAKEESVFYTVKSGDSLWKIAEMHYGKGNGGKYNVIFEANKPMLKDPDKIYPGQVLRIPPLDK